MPFVKEVPSAQIGHLFDYMMGRSTEPVAGLIEDAYDVVGYGLFMALGDGHPAPKFTAPLPNSRDEQAELLKAATLAHGQNFNWQQFAAIALQLLMELLSKQ